MAPYSNTFALPPLNAGNYLTHLNDGLHRNQFGVDIGGPILKNKLFFYFAWEEQRQQGVNSVTGMVFSAKMRTGDFSEFLPTTVVYDPTTGQPFANNVIPSGRLNKYMVDLLSMESLPTRAGITNNWTSGQMATLLGDQYNPRVDYKVSEKDSLFVRGSVQPRSGIGKPAYPSYEVQPNSDSFNFKNVGVGWTRSWRSGVVSETRFGWHKEYLGKTPIPYKTPPQLKIQGLGTDKIDPDPCIWVDQVTYFGTCAYSDEGG